LKLLVLGDFTQREDARKLEDRKPIAIDKNSLDEVLANQALSLALNVPNRLQDDADVEELGIQVRIHSMKDFNPAHLVEQIPELQKLMALREALVALKGPLGNTPSFRKAIEQALADDESRARVLAELALSSQPA
jgi:type VI secretion system protein ImpB